MGQNKEIVDGVNLLPTYRTVGFVSWNDTLGRIEFVRPDDPDTDDFFVPRVLQISTLNSKKGEQAARRFPDKTDGKSIAVYLGLKLVKNGALAIFCGKKTTVNTIAEQISDLIDRQFQESWPLDFSSAEEVSKLLLLHTEHFGKDHALTKVAAVGIFAHSGFTPQGLRLAIEYVMQQGYIRFLICTSTLAQGVNLPIKYLMVTSFYQAKDRIKTRDFHNLIGRAGRSGIHTEGSVLFTDPQIYDKKAYHQDRYNWNLAKGLLDPSRSEPCTSMILTIFDPVRSVDGSLARRMDAVELTRAYTRGDEAVTNFIAEIYNRRRSTRFPLAFVADQIAYKLTIFSAIESYLLAHWESGRMDNTRESIAQLTEATLAFALADEDQQEELVSLFQVLADHVNTAVPSTVKKARFGKTLLGINQLLEIEVWVEDNKEQLATINDPEELLAVIWSLLETQLKHNNLNKLSPAALHYPLALDWLRGASYQALHSSLVKQNAFIRANSQRRKITIEIVVDIVDGAFGYDSTLILGAIAEILRLENNELYEEVLPLLDLLQKRLKYGLDSRLAIAFYEAGFADRIIAAELANRFSTFPVQRMVLLREIKNNRALVRAAIGQYPSYFEYVLDQL